MAYSFRLSGDKWCSCACNNHFRSCLRGVAQPCNWLLSLTSKAIIGVDISHLMNTYGVICDVIDVHVIDVACRFAVFAIVH